MRRELKDMEAVMARHVKEGSGDASGIQNVSGDRAQKKSMSKRNANEEETAGRLDTRDGSQAEERFCLFAETSLDILFQLDEKGMITYCSPAVDKILGYTSPEMEGRYFEDFFAVHKAAKVKNVFQRLISLNKSKLFEINLLAKNGKPVPVEFNLIPLVGDEKSVSVFGVGRDITQRKEADEAVKIERMRLQGVIEHLPEGVVIAEAPSGRLVLANRKFSEMWGHGFIASREIAGYAAYKGFHPDGTPYQSRDWPLVRSLEERKTVSNEEIRLQRADGSFMWVSANSAPLLDEKGRLWGAVATMADISQQKWLERELTQSRDNLQHEVDKRTADLLRANEELKTEVTKRRQFESDLKSATGKILKESKRRTYLSAKLVETLEKDRRDVAMYLHDEIGQMLATLRMDMEYTRNAPVKESQLYRAKLQEFEEKITSLMAYVKDISARLRPDILDTLGLIPALRSLITSFEEDYGLSIHFHFTDPFRELDADVSLTIYRIAQEALNNIAKHAECEEVFVTLVLKKSAVQLTVEDNGIGFDLDSVEDDAMGQGPLGIMIMKERAALAEGELTLESAIGKGTVVSVEIPV